MTKDQFNEITAWQEETFPTATALSKLTHLEQEVKEVKTSITAEEMRMEFADCFILLFGAAKAAGMNYDEIVSSIQIKFGINQRRKWGKPDADGVVNHIKNDPSPFDPAHSVEVSYKDQDNKERRAILEFYANEPAKQNGLELKEMFINEAAEFEKSEWDKIQDQIDKPRDTVGESLKRMRGL